MYLEFQCRITYENGQSYDRNNLFSVGVSKEEYKTVMLGVIKGIPIKEIPGIDDVISRMTEKVQDMDSYINLDGSYRTTRLKKPRAISEMEFTLPSSEYHRIMKMADPEAVFDRPEEHMTLYRNDGSSVNLSSENGKITIRDSRNKTSHTIMDVEHFISHIIY